MPCYSGFPRQSGRDAVKKSKRKRKKKESQNRSAKGQVEVGRGKGRGGWARWLATEDATTRVEGRRVAGDNNRTCSWRLLESPTRLSSESSDSCNDLCNDSKPYKVVPLR